MTRAEFIRHVARQLEEVDGKPPSLLTLTDLCVINGHPRPSRQAIESALAKSGTRGRPTERAKCPTCGQRVDEPVKRSAKVVSPNLDWRHNFDADGKFRDLTTVGHQVTIYPEGKVTGSLTGFERVSQMRDEHARREREGAEMATQVSKQRGPKACPACGCPCSISFTRDCTTYSCERCDWKGSPTVADTSQKPRTKRTARTAKAPRKTPKAK